MSTITNIETTATGYTYTLEAPPATGWDVYLNGTRILTRYTDMTLTLPRGTEIGGIEIDVPPPIEVVSPSEYTLSALARSLVTLQWQHIGATHYIVERGDGDTFVTLDVLPADGEVTHTFEAQTVQGTSHYRVMAAVQDDEGFRPTSRPLPVTVTQALIPEEPLVEMDVAAGEVAIIEVSGL